MTLEHRFAPPRKWRFDVAWLKQKVAIEINGGIFRRGRHSRGAGQVKDFEKLNEAQRLGWVVFQFGTNQLSSKRKINAVLAYVTNVLKTRSKTPSIESISIHAANKALEGYARITLDSFQIPQRRPKPPKAVRRSRS